LSSEAVTAQRPAASVVIRLMTVVCIPVSSRGRGWVVGSAAMHCKAANRMAPLKKQRIEISHVCIACPHTPGGATQPDAK
jgi:hypothetical protein